MKSKNNYKSAFIILHNKDWLDKQRIAGKVVAQTLALLEDFVKEKTTKSLLELDKIAEDFILSQGCTPTFKNYTGGGKIPFPNSVCISVNRALVHGVCTDYKLQNGDIVSFDLGATYKGAIADAARTFIYGEAKSKEHIRMINTTCEALEVGIKSIKIGSRLGAIGNAINKYIDSRGFGVITQYGGHSLTYNKPHSEPFIPNKSLPNEGCIIQPNLTLAIEPMAIIGNTKTYISKDGWTVCGQEVSAHFENTIFIHENNTIEIITQ